MWKGTLTVVLAALVFLSMPVMTEARSPGPFLKLLNEFKELILGLDLSSPEELEKAEKRFNVLCRKIENDQDYPSPEDREKDFGGLSIETIRQYCERLVKLGDPPSLFTTGLFANGFGAEVVDVLEKSVQEGCHECADLNGGEAAKWFHKAAGQGHADAQYSLGILLARGAGMPSNKTVAAEWFHKAAEQGHAKAQYILAAMYDHGQGVPQDAAKAGRWLDKAIDQTRGGVKDTEEFYTRGALEAIKRFYIARTEGDGEARYVLALGKIYAAEGKEFHKAAKQGAVEAQQRALYAYSNAYIWFFSRDAYQGITEAEEIWDIIAESMTPDECTRVLELAVDIRRSRRSIEISSPIVFREWERFEKCFSER